MKQLWTNDLFCGAGGMGLGFKNAGFRLAGAWDFDKYAVESYGNNVSPKVKQADITQMKWDELPKADVWTFGFPCQDLSAAGKQAGLFEGKRSGLFFEVMRLLDETIENDSDRLPDIIMAENVKGLKPYLEVLKAEYNKRGYRMTYTLYNSKYWGVPQNRERYFVVGIRETIRKAFQFPRQQTDFVPKLSSVLETDVDEKYYIDNLKAAKIIEQAMSRIELKETHPCITPDRVDKKQNGRRAKDNEEEMYTLTAQDLHGVIIDNRQATREGTCRVYPNESPTLTATCYKEPKLTIECINPRKEDGTQTYQQDRVYDCNGILPSLTSQLGGRMNVLEKPGEYEQGQRYYFDDGIAPTVTTQGDIKVVAPMLTTSEGGHRQPKILTLGNVNPSGRGMNGQVYHSEGLAPTCTTNKGEGVKVLTVSYNRKDGIEKEIDVAGTLTSSDWRGLNQNQSKAAVVELPQYRVRKLTPREYARLQSFPDSYKQVVSNTQFYKQMGNAVTCNVAQAIAEKIKEFLEKI